MKYSENVIAIGRRLRKVGVVHKLRYADFGLQDPFPGGVKLRYACAYPHSGEGTT